MKYAPHLKYRVWGVFGRSSLNMEISNAIYEIMIEEYYLLERVE